MTNEDMPLDLPPEYRKSSMGESGIFSNICMFSVDLGERTVCRMYSNGFVRPYPHPSSYGLESDNKRRMYTKFPDYAAARAWVEMMCKLNAWELE